MNWIATGIAIYGVAATVVATVALLACCRIKEANWQLANSILRWALDTDAAENIATVASTVTHKVDKHHILNAVHHGGHIPSDVLLKIDMMRSTFGNLSNEDVRCLLLTYVDELSGLDDQRYHATLADVKARYSSVG